MVCHDTIHNLMCLRRLFRSTAITILFLLFSKIPNFLHALTKKVDLIVDIRTMKKFGSVFFGEDTLGMSD